MYHYSVIQWLFFFYLYSFCGWCIESTYVSIRLKKITNRGFMRGPFLPLYGSGALMMLVVSMPFQDNVVMTYFAGCVGATILEYITGVTMETLFKVRYWDYSDKKFNFQGHVCLGTTISWGFLTILMTEIVHVPVERMMMTIPAQILTVITIIVSVCIACDFCLAFKTAINLRNLLVKMERAREEMLRIQKRLDVIIALANAEWENRKEEWTEGITAKKDAFTEGMSVRMEDLKTGIENKLTSIKNMAQSKPSQYLESVREELAELKSKYTSNVESRDGTSRIGKVREFFQREMIRSNPGMTSDKYKDSLEELQYSVQDNNKK